MPVVSHMLKNDKNEVIFVMSVNNEYLYASRSPELQYIR